MNKYELVKEMRASVNGAYFMNVQQFADFFGLHRNTARAVLRDVPKMANRYSISDIADELMKRRKI